MDRNVARNLAVLFALAVLVGFAPHAEAGDFRIERIFGPEVPTGRYKHPASMTELSNGDFYLVYYGGEGEYALDTGVFGSRLKKGTKTWTPPKRIAHDPFNSLGNGVVWEAPDGVVWLFYVVRYGDTWSNSRVAAKISNDQAETWSDASLLVMEEGTLVRNRPLVLSTGEYLLPLYHETGGDQEFTGPDTYSFFLRYDPKTKKWTRSGPLHSPKGNEQPAPAELSPGNLVSYCRRSGDYKPETIGYIVRSESHDGGLTWAEGANSSFPNPNAAVDLLKTRSGKLLLFFNDSMNSRTPLTVALSPDLDRTWPIRRNIVEGEGDFGYPFAFQASDGLIHVVYTSERRSVVNQAIFDEDWIENGPKTVKP
ncbi:sialidase family protein [Paludisphaera borealis]|uniref:Putative retaining sialidase n=1 Tax=Paludisphaera borealis TaxID=1387353 RepID=A0A1U7CUQ9_9BACT|nr:sialidase family protein [Paludisphaera borealis]APW62684.1 putative retaining sialidase [Paludisphaera borealis]